MITLDDFIELIQSKIYGVDEFDHALFNAIESHSKSKGMLKGLDAKFIHLEKELHEITEWAINTLHATPGAFLDHLILETGKQLSAEKIFFKKQIDTSFFQYLIVLKLRKEHYFQNGRTPDHFKGHEDKLITLPRVARNHLFDHLLPKKGFALHGSHI